MISFLLFHLQLLQTKCNLFLSWYFHTTWFNEGLTHRLKGQLPFCLPSVDIVCYYFHRCWTGRYQGFVQWKGEGIIYCGGQSWPLDSAAWSAAAGQMEYKWYDQHGPSQYTGCNWAGKTQKKAGCKYSWLKSYWLI